MPSRRAKILNSKVVFQGRVFGVRQDRVAEPGGVVSTRDVVVHHGSVVLLPIFPDGSILLVRQYRHAVGGFLWELVAGHVEPKESVAAAARRELVEETGYSARRVKKVLELFPSPGLLSERMWVFSATGLTLGVARPEEDESIMPKRFSLAAIERMIRSGSLRDAKSVAGILFYARFLR